MLDEIENKLTSREIENGWRETFSDRDGDEATADALLVRTGEPPLEAMFSGSLISSSIAAVEPFINRDDLCKACDFPATPISAPARSMG